MARTEMFRTSAIDTITRMARGAGTINQQIEDFVREAHRLAADGLTLAEIGQLFTALIALAVEAATKLQNSGDQKKLFVLNAVGYLYDTIAPAIPLPWFLQPFRSYFRPHVRALVLSLADGVVEATYLRLRHPALPTP